MTVTVYWVRVVGTEDYCLMWGDNSPRWEGSKENALERAKGLTATSYSHTKYEIVPVVTSESKPEDL